MSYNRTFPIQSHLFDPPTHNITGTHPLLAQVPLTVSPFVNLPTSTTLPYTYKPMPSTLPPSSVLSSASASEDNSKPRYVISQSGHAAHPDDIIASCRALQSYVTKLQNDSERELRELDERIRARELAEKRRVAPGWLDSEARLLEPERKGGEVVDLMSTDVGGEASGAGAGAMVSEMAGNEDEGAQMDRAFGSMTLRPKEN